MSNLVTLGLICYFLGIYLYFKYADDEGIHNLGGWLFWIGCILLVIGNL